jgi:poly(hydroxyalkanoate) granule-associated protein
MAKSEEEKSIQDQMKETMVDVRNEAIVQTANLYLMARKTLLASLGAAALTFEQASAIVDQLAERGEVVEADLQKWANEVGGSDAAPTATRGSASTPPTGAGQSMSMAGKALEESIEVILSRFNVPTKSDIETLSQKINSLNQKVNALLEQQGQEQK